MACNERDIYKQKSYQFIDMGVSAEIKIYYTVYEMFYHTL